MTTKPTIRIGDVVRWLDGNEWQVTSVDGQTVDLEREMTDSQGVRWTERRTARPWDCKAAGQQLGMELP